MAGTIQEKTKTFIVILLDESGSMGAMKNDVLGGYNEFLSTQRELSTDDARISLIKFSTRTTIGHEPIGLNAAPALTTQNYSPGGGTALFDAIADGIRIADKNKTPEERVLCLIMTDGEENSSKETTLQQVRDLIAAREAHGDWTFAYIGEQPDGWAGQVGMHSANAMVYAQNDVRANFSSASVATRGYRVQQHRATQNFFR